MLFESQPQCFDEAIVLDAAVPVHDCCQIHENALHRNMGGIGRPNLVGPVDFQSSEQIRVDLVLRIGLAGLGPEVNSLQAHKLNEPLPAFAVYFVAQPPQMVSHEP